MLRRLIRSLWHAYARWCRFDCVDLSAAFAYYTLQSIFPLLLIVLSIASWSLGRQVGLSDQIVDYAAGFFPPSVVSMVQVTLEQLVKQGVGAGLLGAGALLITAANVYLTLQRGADRIWQGVLPHLAMICPGGSKFGSSSKCVLKPLLLFCWWDCSWLLIRLVPI